MKVIVERTERGLRGVTRDDHDRWQRFRRRLEVMKVGDCLRLEFSRPRNPAHHRKFFALLNLIAENHETFDTPDKALVALKLIVGHCELVIHPLTGEVVTIPKSINFESMDQEAFEPFYSACLDAVLQHLLPQISEAQADRLLDMIVAGYA